jgi:hypothetical protein
VIVKEGLKAPHSNRLDARSISCQKMTNNYETLIIKFEKVLHNIDLVKVWYLIRFFLSRSIPGERESQIVHADVIYWTNHR